VIYWSADATNMRADLALRCPADCHRASAERANTASGPALVSHRCSLENASRQNQHTKSKPESSRWMHRRQCRYDATCSRKNHHDASRNHPPHCPTPLYEGYAYMNATSKKSTDPISDLRRCHCRQWGSCRTGRDRPKQANSSTHTERSTIYCPPRGEATPDYRTDRRVGAVIKNPSRRLAA
jgi:hypothetical protein